MNNTLIIHYHGEIKYSDRDNIILISEDSNWKTDFIKKQLQIDYLNIEDYVKATQLINQELNEINKIIIINNNYELNMISYQYKYEAIKKNYYSVGNLIFLCLTCLLIVIYTCIYSFAVYQNFCVHKNKMKIFSS